MQKVIFAASSSGGKVGGKAAGGGKAGGIYGGSGEVAAGGIIGDKVAGGGTALAAKLPLAAELAAKLPVAAKLAVALGYNSPSIARPFSLVAKVGGKNWEAVRGIRISIEFTRDQRESSFCCFLP